MNIHMLLHIHMVNMDPMNIHEVHVGAYVYS